MSIFADPKVRARVAELVAAAPPLTSEQRTRLAAIFATVAPTRGAA